MKTRRLAWSRGFTLIEVMVAFAVFLLLVLLVTQLITETSRNTVRENNKMDALGDTRQALDRFGLDWAARVRRADVDWQVSQGADNDAVTLLSQVPAYEGARKLAAVSYRINADTLVLERGTLGYDWDGTGAKLSFSTNATVPNVPAGASYETLSPTIFRMSLSFLDKQSGRWTNAPPGALNSDQLGGVVVSVAALDERNRGLLSNTQLKALSAALGDPVGTNNPLTVWTEKLNDPGFASGLGLPLSAVGEVRLHQRIFYREE